MIRNAQDDPSSRPSEIIVVHANDRSALLDRLASVAAELQESPRDVELAELANRVNQRFEVSLLRLAIVADTRDTLLGQLDRAIQRLSNAQCRSIHDVSGIYFAERPIGAEGKLALLFPGEASQYAGMLQGLTAHFRGTTEILDRSRVAAEQLNLSPEALLDFLFQPIVRDTTPRLIGDRSSHATMDYAMAIHSVLMANWIFHDIVHDLEIPVNVMAGHSAGEFSLLSLSGVVDSEADLFRLVTSLDDLITSTPEHIQASLLAVALSAGKVREMLAAASAARSAPLSLYVAMDNCPHQTVVVGESNDVEQFESILRENKAICERLALDRPYHTPLFAPFMEPMRRAMDQATFVAPRLPIYSATTADYFPNDPHAIRELAVAHWAAPVRFTDLIRRMYDDGVRVFVEAGPRGNLTAFVQDILRGREFQAIPLNTLHKSPIGQIQHAVAQLVAHHIHVRSSYLYRSPVPVTAVVPSTQTLVETAHTPQRINPHRTECMHEFQKVMSNFLDVQQSVMTQYLDRRKSGGRPATRFQPPAQGRSKGVLGDRNTAADALTKPHPLLGEIIEFASGERLVTRRRLDLAQDPYAHHHSVGGRDVSEVDPEQHGLPVVPMTFTLEMMGALAKQLFPHLSVVRIEDVRLHRWLAYHEHDPVLIEALAHHVVTDPRDTRLSSDQVRVRVEIRDLGGRIETEDAQKTAAIGDVILAHSLPQPPTTDITLTNGRPSRLTLERLYQNLFHGRRFHGVDALAGFGEHESIGQIRALPRNDLFAFDDDPQFLFDPIMLDVAMHIMAGWHLEHDDQAGRLTLPFKLDAIEFFGTCPAVGTRFEVRTRTTRETSRQFGHDVHIVDGTGRLFARYHGVRLWRFYLPVGEVNFHGPKNIYYLSENWPDACPQIDEHLASSGVATACVRLKPPGDLVQPAMLSAASKVMLSTREQQEYVRLDLPAEQKVVWLFSRAAMKEAVRRLWHNTTGRRLFAADVEIYLDDHGRWESRPRDAFLDGPFPYVACAIHDGTIVAIAALGARPGIALGSRLDDNCDPLLSCASHRSALGTPGSLSGDPDQQSAIALPTFASHESLRVATCLVAVDNRR